MERDQPTYQGTPLAGARPSRPFRPYVYHGGQPHQPKPVKT